MFRVEFLTTQLESLGIGLFNWKKIRKELTVTPILLDTTLYSVPEGGVLTHVTTQDGLRLRAMHWDALTASPRGTILLLQGRADFIEKYIPTSLQLRRRGFAVVLFDWRGQGGSDRLLRYSKAGHVGDFSAYQTDLEAVTKQIVLSDCPPPFFLLGYSMGATVLLLSALRLQTQYTRAVCAAPFCGLPAPAFISPFFLQGMLQFMTALPHYLGFGWMTLPGSIHTKWASPYDNSFQRNVLTSDPLRFAQLRKLVKRNPHLTVNTPSFDWLFASSKALSVLSNPKHLASIRLPLLFILAGNDQVVSNQAAEALVAHLPTAHAVEIPGARHALLQERSDYQALFWAAFDAFIPGRDRKDSM